MGDPSVIRVPSQHLLTPLPVCGVGSSGRWYKARNLQALALELSGKGSLDDGVGVHPDVGLPSVS